MTFTPDKYLWISHHHQLRYCDKLELARLQRAALKYYEFSPEGRPDLYAWKYVETRMLEGSLLRIFQDFYFNGYLWQLKDWIPY